MPAALVLYVTVEVWQLDSHVFLVAGEKNEEQTSTAFDEAAEQRGQIEGESNLRHGLSTSTDLPLILILSVYNKDFLPFEFGKILIFFLKIW